MDDNDCLNLTDRVIRAICCLQHNTKTSINNDKSNTNYTVERISKGNSSTNKKQLICCSRRNTKTLTTTNDDESNTIHNVAMIKESSSNKEQTIHCSQRNTTNSTNVSTKTKKR